MTDLYSGDERVIRHDLDHLCASEMWGHLGGPVIDLLDAKDAEIARLRAENERLRRELAATLVREQALEARLPRADREPRFQLPPRE